MRVRSSADVAHLVRVTRQGRCLSQEDLALAAGVSRRWLINLEAGKPGVELGLVLSVLNALGIALVADTTDGPASGPHAPAVGGVDLDEHLSQLAGPG